MFGKKTIEERVRKLEAEAEMEPVRTGHLIRAAVRTMNSDRANEREELAKRFHNDEIVEQRIGILEMKVEELERGHTVLVGEWSKEDQQRFAKDAEGGT